MPKKKIKKVISSNNDNCSDNKLDFFEKNKDLVLTHEIIKENSLCDVPDNYSYECHICNNVVKYYETDNCNCCNIRVCFSCVKNEFIMCNEKNCPRCRRCNCYNNKIITYCTECYVNPLDKYEGKIITHDMLRNDDDYCDIRPYDEEQSGKHLYECPVCDQVNCFREVIKCEYCKKYVC